MAVQNSSSNTINQVNDLFSPLKKLLDSYPNAFQLGCSENDGYYIGVNLGILGRPFQTNPLVSSATRERRITKQGEPIVIRQEEISLTGEQILQGLLDQVKLKEEEKNAVPYSLIKVRIKHIERLIYDNS